MGKRTAVVDSEFGTFTRKTDRTYTHAIVACGQREEFLRAHLKDGGFSGQPLAPEVQERLILENRERIAKKQGGVLTYCGRPDLAQTQFNNAVRDGYALVAIVPVTYR